MHILVYAEEDGCPIEPARDRRAGGGWAVPKAEYCSSEPGALHGCEWEPQCMTSRLLLLDSFFY